MAARRVGAWIARPLPTRIRLLTTYAALRRSTAFDPTFYLDQYPDVAAAGLDPLVLYIEPGWREGRDPNAAFSTRAHLERQPDVSASGVNPLPHKIRRRGEESGEARVGASEIGGRGEPPVEAAARHPEIVYSGAFDEAFYLLRYPDVAEAGIDPLTHFLTHGWREGRDPNPLFSTVSYLEQHPGLRTADTDTILRVSASYRAYVGPAADYDIIGGLQFSLLFHAGLRESHRLLDVGCGSLRGGRLFIPYLLPGNYYGVEPSGELLEAGLEHELGQDVVRVKRPTFATNDDFDFSSFGTKFDFVVAQSILSHTYPDLAALALGRMSEVLATEGVLFATFVEGEQTEEGSGWLYPAPVAYAWDDMRALAGGARLSVRRLAWPHPRQVWFVAAKSARRTEEAAGRLDAATPGVDAA
jgi:SAM-dependent methyltransferase